MHDLILEGLFLQRVGFETDSAVKIFVEVHLGGSASRQHHPQPYIELALSVRLQQQDIFDILLGDSVGWFD